MLNLGKNTRLPVGVEYTDFSLGYNIVDGRVEEFIERQMRLNDDYKSFGEIPTIDSESDLSFTTFEERYSKINEEQVLLAKEFFPSNTTVYFIAKNKKIEKVVSQAKLFLDYIDNLVQNQKIAWSFDGETPNYQDNKELSDDLRNELFPEIMKQVSLSLKLNLRMKEISEFWKESTQVRFNWTIGLFCKKFKELKYDLQLVNEWAPKYITILESKDNRKFSKEEKKIIWSILGLCNSGFDINFPILDPSFEANDIDTYKRVCSLVGSFIWWSLAYKMNQETKREGKEPLEIVAEDDNNGPHYTSDCNDIIQKIYEGTGEQEFKMCFNSYTYVDKNNEEQTIIYKSPSDSKELNKSIEKAVSIGNWIMKLYDRNINLHTFRTHFPGKPIDNLNILQYIAYLSGRRWTLKEVEIEIEDTDENNQKVIRKEIVTAKKMSDKILLDYNEKRLLELFWSCYNNQKEKGLIISKEKQLQEIVEAMIE